MMKTLVALSLISTFCGCEPSGPLSQSNSDLETLSYRDLQEAEIPPCLNMGASIDTCVIKSLRDYDRLRIRYPIQGEYEVFVANGLQTRFRLSYQPLDLDNDGRITPDELIIYLTGVPIYVIYQGDTIRVHSNPFYVVRDSILTFDDQGMFDTKIPCSLVFSVDPVTGEAIFVSPPPNGNRLSMCAHRLYDEFAGRICSMDYFDFASYSIIEKQVHSYYPHPIVIGIEKQILKSPSRRTITYLYRPVLGTMPSPEIHTFRSWVAIDRIPEGYSVRFVELR